MSARERKFFRRAQVCKLQLHALVSILMAESGRCLAQQFTNRLWEEATETAAYDFTHTYFQFWWTENERLNVADDWSGHNRLIVSESFLWFWTPVICLCLTTYSSECLPQNSTSQISFPRERERDFVDCRCIFRCQYLLLYIFFLLLFMRSSCIYQYQRSP